MAPPHAEQRAWSKAAILAIAFTTFLSSTAFYLNLPALPLYVAHLDRGHATAWLGPIVGITFLVSAVVNPFWGALADRFGQHKMMLRAAGAVTLVYAFTPLANTPLTFLVLRFFAGLASGYIPAATALLSKNVDDEQLGRAMSIMSVARNSGALVGPALGALLLAGGTFNMVYESAAVIMLLCFALTLLLPRATAPALEPRAVDRDLILGPFRSLGRGTTATGMRPVLLVVLLTSMASAVVQMILPLQLAHGDRQGGRALAGIAFSIGGVASLLTAYGWGWLTDKVGVRRLLPSVFGLGVVFGVAQSLSTSTWAILVSYTLYCIALCEVFTLLTVALTQTAPPETRGMTFGMNNTVTQLGQAFGPAAAGFVVAASSLRAGILLAVSMFVVAFIVTRHSFKELQGKQSEEPATSGAR
ncbi:MFS transporter [Kitasatospora sp. NPDC056531]|uniref:MFS transporter n=1 Tax=Kitasatospora sp. NPDC056531 TaxID=3345856 RepID=UPI0036B0BA25